tara:strand:- start:163 stop:420 length:258 start_codon:yes stop_codon:yes gene_type:complete
MIAPSLQPLETTKFLLFRFSDNKDSPREYSFRGLDYYTQTTFEIISNDIGAQDALLGGGRYDGLIMSLGGKDTPAVGFAGGTNSR